MRFVQSYGCAPRLQRSDKPWHTPNDAMVSQRITHNDNHHGATHPIILQDGASGGQDGGGTTTGGNKRGRRWAQYRNRATTTASGRAQDRIPVLLLPLNCWLTTCKVARIGRGVGPFGEGTATSMCTIDDTHQHTNVQHTHTHTHTHAHPPRAS